MSALVRIFACTAPTLLVLLLSTQGTFSQTADPLKSPFGLSPAAEPVAKKIPGKTAHRLGVSATPQKSASQASRKKITTKTAQRLGPPVDPQKSASDASPAADLTSKLPERTAHRLDSPADPQKSASQASTAADVTGKIPEKTGHRLVLQVASNEPGAMNLALNNATNVAEHFRASGEKVQIEIVVYGPGLHMLRDDTSPVKSRIASLSQSSPNISFMACNNTQQNMQKQESKEIPLVPEAKIVKSGVVRVMELQEQGWTYVRP